MLPPFSAGRFQSLVFTRLLIRLIPLHESSLPISLVMLIIIAPRKLRNCSRDITNYRILLLFLVWMSFQKKISWLFTEQDAFRDSFHNHSQLLNLSQVLKELSFQSKTQSKGSI